VTRSDNTEAAEHFFSRLRAVAAHRVAEMTIKNSLLYFIFYCEILKFKN
jgi:hypothetical protein